MPKKTELPLSNRSDADVPGHWLLARLGKRVLRPGGLELTTTMLERSHIHGADVVEFAPGLGRTARDIIALNPGTYTGVDSDENAAAAVRKIVAPAHGHVVVADAAATGLPGESADVVLGEALLTMQGDRGKDAMIAEAVRLLRPGGRYAIHELGLQPDSLAAEIKDSIRKELAQSIRVNARPLTISEWSVLLKEAGLTIEHVATAPMALLEPQRILADEGLVGTLRFVKNLIVKNTARKRVLAMRRTFMAHKKSLIAVTIIATKAEPLPHDEVRPSHG